MSFRITNAYDCQLLEEALGKERSEGGVRGSEEAPTSASEKPTAETIEVKLWTVSW